MDPWGDFTSWFVSVFYGFKNPPMSIILIVIVSLSISFISNIALKLTTDVKQLARYSKEIKEFQKLKMEAQKTQNKKLLQKVKRKEKYISKIQSYTMKARFKPMLIFFIPFLILFSLLRALFEDGIVAILPFNLDKIMPVAGWAGISTNYGFGLYFWAFYFLVGFGLSTILQKLMGTSPQ